MPKSSYFQTIARHAKPDSPRLQPPRSLPSRIEVSQLSDFLTPPVFEPLESSVSRLPPVRSLKADPNTISSAQALSSPPLLDEAAQSLPVLIPTFNAASPSRQLATPESPSWEEVTPRDHPSAKSSRSAPTLEDSNEKTGTIASVPPPVSQLPEAASVSRVAPSVEQNLAVPVAGSFPPSASTPVTQRRSYLQAAIRIAPLELGSTSSQSSKAAMVPVALISETTMTDSSESAVILQPSPLYSSKRTRLGDRDSDMLSQANHRSSQLSNSSPQSNTIHIGTIDIQVVPPPQPVGAIAPIPKPMRVTPLARGFTSSFGLRQG